MRSFVGEFAGTFILVLFGCGAVGWSLFIEPLDLIVIALVWGAAVALAIYCSSTFSKAHLNPAVSLGFLVKKDIRFKALVPYLSGQFLGAFLAAVILHQLFKDYLNLYSMRSAMMFGEYYPNPGNFELTEFSEFKGFLVEFSGTFLLMFGILLISKIKGNGSKFFNPLLIGFLLSSLIYFFAPYTQAGFNPARDFSPRLYSYLMGWDRAFSYNGTGWLVVYIVAPITGAVLAGLCYKLLFRK